MLDRRIRRGLLFSGLLAVAVLVTIALYADAPRMLTALADFRWQFLPLLLCLTLLNYIGRFLKWQYYLKRLDLKIPWRSSLLIFVSGLSMAITPGKVGELLKSYLLKRAHGAPISRTAPIIVAERLTDGIAMLGLAATGLILYRAGWEILLLLLILGAAGITVIQNRALSLWLIDAAAKLPPLKRLSAFTHAFYESAYILLRWRPLLLAIGIGLISWSGECLALYCVYLGLGIPASSDLLIKSAFILACSSLIGSATGLPGGLGPADGSILGLTHLLVSPLAALGGAATLLIRFSTLWFGLALGFLALACFRLITHVPLFSPHTISEEHMPSSADSTTPISTQPTTEQSVLHYTGEIS